MAIDLHEFARLRPSLFHVTAQENLARITRTRTLESVGALISRAGRPELSTSRRREHVPVVDGESIMIRDQAPLHPGNMVLDADWTFEQFVRSLNGRVFFWPGSEKGPISYGVRHFGRYEAEQPKILRVRSTSLFQANEGAGIELSRVNSGSPRWNKGIPAPRGASTFVRPEDSTFRASEVVEVTIRDRVTLPGDAEVSDHPEGPWFPLW